MIFSHQHRYPSIQSQKTIQNSSCHSAASLQYLCKGSSVLSEDNIYITSGM